MTFSKYYFFLICFIIIFNTTLLIGDSIELYDIQYLSSYSDSFASKDNFNGSILISYNDKIIFKKAYGYSNYEKKINNTTSTKFLLASMTKQFTAMGILILCKNGKLLLDDTLYKYFPKFPNSKKITIHSLLTHTSGLVPVFYNYYTKDKYPNHFIDFINLSINNRSFRFSSDPSLYNFNYSDVNYQLLGAIIEIVANQSYENFINAYIFKPLHMVNSGFGYNPTKIPDMATCYLPNKHPFLINLNMTQLGYSAAGIYSTIEDLFLWNQALFNNTLIPSEYSTKMFSKYNNIYGYGWWFFNFDKNGISYSFPQHGGRHLNGISSCFYIRDTISNSCVIILGNDGNHDSKMRYAQYVIQYLQK